MKKLFCALALSSVVISPLSHAADYIIDSAKAHASINFRIQHLGYSWLTGRFNDFSGKFNFDDKNIEDATVTVIIDPASIDTNHAERDKHLRSDDFLDVSKFTEARFVSSSVEKNADGSLKVIGDFTLHGVTKKIAIDANFVGQGKDPWGGYRAGFTGTTSIALKDFGIDYNLGPASQVVDLQLEIEGIRQ